MNLLKDSKKTLNCQDYQLTISDIQLDVYRIAFNKGLTHPHYELKLKQGGLAFKLKMLPLFIFGSSFSNLLHI